MDSSKLLGVIGGSGFYTFDELKIIDKVSPKTRYGKPSSSIIIGEYKGSQVAFIPRHGNAHELSPSKIPYKANIYALKEIGVTHIVGTSVVGSLKRTIKPGFFVLPDQFVDFTTHRTLTSANQKRFYHLPMAEPYSVYLRSSLSKILYKLRYPYIDKATVVIIEGPRFSTKAESHFFIRNQWDIVNMTQYPECYFAKEAKIYYAALCTVTDYDCGLSRSISFSEDFPAVKKLFIRNTERTKKVLLEMVATSKKIMESSPEFPPHLEEYFKETT